MTENELRVFLILCWDRFRFRERNEGKGITANLISEMSGVILPEVIEMLNAIRANGAVDIIGHKVEHGLNGHNLYQLVVEEEDPLS